MISYDRLSRACRQTALLLMLMSFSFMAYSHTGLKTSNPVDEAVINKAPEQIHLTFTASVSLVRFNIADVEGRQVEVDFKPSLQPAVDYHLAIPSLSAGSYRVDWAVIGADGHTVSDSFGFVVDPAATAQQVGQPAAQNHAH